MNFEIVENYPCQLNFVLRNNTLRLGFTVQNTSTTHLLIGRYNENFVLLQTHRNYFKTIILQQDNLCTSSNDKIKTRMNALKVSTTSLKERQIQFKQAFPISLQLHWLASSSRPVVSSLLQWERLKFKTNLIKVCQALTLSSQRLVQYDCAIHENSSSFNSVEKKTFDVIAAFQIIELSKSVLFLYTENGQRKTTSFKMMGQPRFMFCLDLCLIYDSS